MSIITDLLEFSVSQHNYGASSVLKDLRKALGSISISHILSEDARRYAATHLPDGHLDSCVFNSLLQILLRAGATGPSLWMTHKDILGEDSRHTLLFCQALLLADLILPRVKTPMRFAAWRTVCQDYKALEPSILNPWDFEDWQTAREGDEASDPSFYYMHYRCYLCHVTYHTDERVFVSRLNERSGHLGCMIAWETSVLPEHQNRESVFSGALQRWANLCVHIESSN